MKRIHYMNFALLFLFLFPVVGFAHFGTKGPYGGTVSCAIVNDTTVYFGTANGGVFESTNSKIVGWRARPVGLKSGKITALAHSGKELYAGTADSGIYIFNGSAGNDRYWNQINNGLTNLKIKSLIAIDAETLLAGTDGNGIFKTVNKGATWTQVSTTSLNNAVITGFAKSGNRIFVIGLTQGVFTSDNKGDTWSDFNDANTLNIPGATSISFNATSNELIVLNGNGLLKTAVAASSPVAAYSAANNGLPLNTIPQGISNNGTAWFLVSSNGIFSSLANAINWTAINTGLTTTNVSAVAAFQTTLVAGTFGEGIFKASITNPSWTAVNFGFNNLKTFSMACSGEAVVVAATEKGVFVSKDLGNIYKRANKGLTDSLHVNDIIFWGSKLIAGTQNSGVFISSDTGASWTSFNNGITGSPVLRFFASASYIYAFDQMCGVFQSSGTSWKSIFSAPQSHTPGSITFSGGKVIMSVRDKGVMISDEAAIGWTDFSNGLPKFPLNPVTSLTARGSKIFAGTDGGGVYITDLAADNWTATAPTTIPHTTLIGLNATKIQSMATYGGYVFASYKGGLVASSDNGVTWIPGGNQFNLPSYTNVNKIAFVNTRVFVTTDHNCLYSNSLSELPPNGLDEQDSSIGNFSVYPNPSAGIIHLDLQRIKGNVKEVIVYDQSGRKINVIQVITSLNQGVQLNLSPGIYHIQVVTAAGTAVQKIVIE